MSFQYLVPPQRENLMTQEKILCLFSIGSPQRENLMSFQFWPPPMRKSFVSCLMRKSHVFSVLAPPMRKSPVSCLMRKSHVSRENLMSYQFWVPLLNEKISCLLSHEKIS